MDLLTLMLTASALSPLFLWGETLASHSAAPQPVVAWLKGTTTGGALWVVGEASHTTRCGGGGAPSSRSGISPPHPLFYPSRKTLFLKNTQFHA